MPRPLSQLSDAELQAVAAGFPALDQLSDDQLAGVAVQQGLLQDEEAVNAVQAKKAGERQAELEQHLPPMPTREEMLSNPDPEFAQNAIAARELTRAALTKGGKVGDVAIGVVTPIGGAIMGAPGGIPGVAAGGGAGGLAGESLVQARQYYRGERDEPSKGRLIANTAASAVPLGGPLLKGPVRTIVTRGLQGAGIATTAEAAGQLLDEGKVNFTQLAATGALGFLFGSGAGAVESRLVRKAVLDQIRRTPEFAGFDGTDAQLVDAVRAKINAKPEPVDVTPTAAEPAPVTPEQPALPAGEELLRKAEASGVTPPEAPAAAPEAPAAAPEVPAPVKPLDQLSNDELRAAAGQAALMPAKLPPPDFAADLTPEQRAARARDQIASLLPADHPLAGQLTGQGHFAVADDTPVRDFENGYNDMMELYNSVEAAQAPEVTELEQQLAKAKGKEKKQFAVKLDAYRARLGAIGDQAAANYDAAWENYWQTLEPRLEAAGIPEDSWPDIHDQLASELTTRSREQHWDKTVGQVASEVISDFQSRPAAPEPQESAAPAPGVEVPSAGSAPEAARPVEEAAGGGQASETVPAGAPAVTPEKDGYRLINTFDSAAAASAVVKPGKNYRMVTMSDGKTQLWFKSKGRGFQVGSPPDGSSDLLNDIAELGGIAPPKGKNDYGHDGFVEAFGQGKARLLRRAGASSPDSLLEELNSLGKGYNFQSIDEFYQAVINTAKQREKMTRDLRALEHEGKLSTALFENKGRKADLAAKKPVNADTLQEGDAFTVRGEPVKVIGIDPDTGAVTIRNGATITIPAGTDIYPDKGRVKRARSKVTDPNMPFEDSVPYANAHSRYVQLRALEKEGKLDAAGQAELDRVEKTLGQDFLDFYTAEKKGAATSLGDKSALERAELKRRGDARLQAADLQSQVDLFGPSSDKEGQFSLFETAAGRYLDARQVTHPIARSAIRSILSGVRERHLTRQLDLDLRTDAELVAGLEAPRRLPQPAGQPGQDLRLGGAVDALPDAKVGPQPGGLHLDSRLYTQAFLAEGFLEHTGRVFENVAQLVSAAQVLRNRNVETLWVLPYDKEGRLLAPFAFSSRLPNMVNLGENSMARLGSLLAGVKAASFDLLHNHPSGSPRPSSADQRFTQQVGEAHPGLRSHIVINHGTYSVITEEGLISALEAEVPAITAQPDPTLLPKTNNLLGRVVLGTAEAIRIGYQLQLAPAQATLFLMSTKNVIVGTASVAAADVGALGFESHLRELARNVGAVTVVAYYDGSEVLRPLLAALYSKGVLLDVIANNRHFNASLQDSGDVVRELDKSVFIFGRPKTLFADTPTVAMRIAEDGPEPTEAAEPPVPAPTHYVTKFDRTAVPQPLAQMKLVRPVEMPELVELVKQLAGTIPSLKNLPRARGYMMPRGRGSIVLDRRIFIDPVGAAQTLAHELGHLVDYLPDQTMNRGNLLGRLATLRGYLANGLPLDPASGTSALTAKERAAIRREAEKKVGKRPPQDEEADLAAWQDEVRKVYSELLQAELEQRGLAVARGRKVEGGADVVGVGDIGKELEELSYWWRPLVENAPEGYYIYRASSVEIYADTLSVLFNAPKEFRDRAPVAWKMFFNYVDQKPEVKSAIFDLWDLLHQGANALSAVRRENLRTGFAKAEEILLAKAAERDARRNSLPAIIENFKQKHFNVYAPIIDRARQARAVRPLKWWEDPEFVFDAHPFAENANYRFLDRVQKTVLTPLEDIGVDSDTLGDFLFFNRVAHEAYLVNEQLTGRAVLANPLGHTPQTARRELLVMRYRLGPTRFETMRATARRFQDLALEVIERGWASGIYSDEQLALARDNRHNYVTFAVVDYLEQSTHIPAAFKQQRGTLRTVANPFLATVLKMMTVNKFSELNQAKRVTVQLLSQRFPGEISLAKVTKIPLANGRLMFRPKPPPPGRRELVVLDQGRPIAWHVEPEIADMFEHTAPAAAHAIVGVTNWVFRNVFYPAFITYNPAFQLYANPIRDLSRSYVKLPPGVKRRHWLGEQLRAHRGARARLLNDINGAELERRRQLRALAKRRPLEPAERDELQLLDDRALAIELLVHRGLTTPFESFASNPMRDDVWGKMLAEYRLAPGTPDHGAALRQWLGHVPGLGRLLDRIEFAGQTAEAMPKLGAYRVLTRELGWTPEQAAYYVRNHVGTPNFTKKGRWTVWDGTVFPFINIFMRGLESDVQQARGRIPGVPIDPRAQKFSYWRRMAERTLVPRLLQALAAAGLLGVGLKKYYDAWSDYNKANYLILPLGTEHDGKAEFGYKSVGLRIPEDETARLLGGIVHYVVQAAATQDDPAAKSSLSNLANFAGGQVPGINPVFTLADGWAQYSSGINPRDRMRGNPVMSDVQFKAGGWNALGGMFAWTWDEVGGGNFVRYDPEANTWQEHLVGSLPILSRAVKVTDSGLRERQRTLEAALDTRNAQIRLAMPTNVNQLLAEYYRLNAVRKENRTPVQQARLAELSYWHSKVWQPNYEMMQDAPPDSWKGHGQLVGEISKAFERQ